jgi:beta propeller repeat protein
MYPSLWDDLLAWQDDRNGNWDIYAFDFKSGSETKLTGDGDQVYPDVSGNTIAWEDDRGVEKDITYYLWDKRWSKTYSRKGNQSSPVVSGKYIAYVDGDGSNTSLRKLDLSSLKDELVAAGPGQVKPSMDRRLVWLNSVTGRPRTVPVASGQISAICKAPGNQSRPSVGGDDQVGYYVAWMDNRTGIPGVYVYSLQQELELPLVAGLFPNMYPDIYGNVIAWTAFNPISGFWAIRTFELDTGNRTQLVNLSVSGPISLSDQYLAYGEVPTELSGWMVFKKFLYGKEPTPDFPPRGMNARAGGDITVYQSKDKGRGDSDVWIWRKGQSPVALIKSPGDQINPSTDGLTAVWQDNRNGNWDIYALDLKSGQETQITKDLADQTNPDVDNGVIVWQDKRKGGWDIYSYDISAKKERIICADPGDQTEPRIGAGRIVWTDNRDGNEDIYIYENYEQ